MIVMSIWHEFNPNPLGQNVGDCAVRAISAALDVDWYEAFSILCATGYKMCNLPNADSVWGAVLKHRGFTRHVVPDTCPDCYTARDFALEHPVGIYTLGFGGHTATIRDGILLDSWNSENEIPQFYWTDQGE